MRRPNIFQVMTAALAVLILALVVGGGAWLASLVVSLRSEGVDREQQIESLSRTVQEANDRLEAVGEAPVPVPAASTAPAQGQRGQDGVAGDTGPQGEPGRPPTGAEIAAGVSMYCSVRIDCAGPAGQDGRPGTAGQDGTDGDDGAPGVAGAPGEPGAPGRAPTAEEIAAAVAAFCGTPSSPCAGPKGDPGAAGMPGAPGAPGAPGRGIDRIECADDSQWRVYYTDDPSVGYPVPGPCRATLLPEIG